MKKIAQTDIKLLAETYGTPLYVYDKGKMAENYHRMKSAFEANYPKTKIHFSVKSNSNPNILSIFRELGSGADCSSPAEVFISLRSGFLADKIIYTGNYESIEDLRYLAENRITINFDDISSYRRMMKIQKPEIVSFRINPGIGKGGFEGITTAGADAKFGIPYEMASDAYNEAKAAGIKRFGLQMMTGSNNLEPYYFAETVEKLMNIAGGIFPKLGVKPEYIDIGGGYGVPYSDDEPELNIEMTAKLVTEAFKDKCKKYSLGEPALILEPGRYLIANAGYLLSRVTGVKNSYRNFIGLDAGMNTLIRPALYGARHRIKIYGKPRNSRMVNICGQICENSDIFATNIPFPETEENDIAIFLDAGAYGYVMASNYNNRLRPAEVLVDGSKHRLIRRRENPDDLLRNVDFS